MIIDSDGPSLEEMGINADGKEKSLRDRAMEKGLYKKYTYEEAMAYYTGSSLQSQEHALEALLNYQHFRARPDLAKYNDMYPVMDGRLSELTDEQLSNIIKSLEKPVRDQSET